VATPSLTRHRLPGYLGDILVDVRTGDRSRPRPAVLVLHGFKGFKDWGMFPPLAERLAKAGFTAVSFNLSGSGVDDTGEFVFPDRFARATFSGDRGDIGKVLEAVATGALDVAPPPSIGFFGHSRGGGLGVLAAAADPRIGRGPVLQFLVPESKYFFPGNVVGDWMGPYGFKQFGHIGSSRVWEIDDSETLYRKVTERGIRAVAMHKHPEVFIPQDIDSYRDHFEIVLETADGILMIPRD